MPLNGVPPSHGKVPFVYRMLCMDSVLCGRIQLQLPIDYSLDSSDDSTCVRKALGRKRARPHTRHGVRCASLLCPAPCIHMTYDGCEDRVLTGSSPWGLL